jgi:reactive intermediate/imine deaminase
MTRRQEGRTDAAPVPVGPYSQCVRIGDVIAVAGQVGRDPATGLMADGVRAQTDLTFRNIAAVLETQGASLDDVVRVDVYLTTVDDFAAMNFAAMNEVYASWFRQPYPARTTVYVGLAPGDLVEITVLAVARS